MQAGHGGDLASFCRQFGFREDEVMDYSSSLNWFLPEIDDASWLRWKASAGVYGDASARAVSARIADLFSYDENQVLASAGAIEAIYLTAQLFRDHKVLIGSPGFADYKRAFRASEVKTWDLSIDDPVLEWAEVVIFGSPNNPTGKRYSLAEWRARWPGKIWLVDETFVEFSKHPASTPEQDVILFRSLTKSWKIPGLRLGFLLTSNQKWMKELASLQAPWSVSALAQAWVKDRLNKAEKRRVYLSISEQVRERGRMMGRLADIDAVRVHSSDANFFLIELLHGGAGALWEALARDGFLLRKGDDFEGLQRDCFLRLAVRRPEDNNQLIDSLRDYFEQL